MFMHGYGRWEGSWLVRLVMSDTNEFFLQISGFSLIWQYIFLGEVGGKQCWHNIRRGGYLMMMLDYKEGRGRGQESG